MTNDHEQNWSVLKSDYLHKEPWLTVRKDVLKMPGGHIIPAYYVHEYPDWVNVIAITREGLFVFVRQYRHGLGSIYYELCAGVRDPEDASPLKAAQRELLEETGYGKGEWEEIMVISANPSTTSNLTYCYLATNVELISEPSLDESEDISVHLFTSDEVKCLLESDQIVQALHAAPLWKYMAQHPK